MTHRPSPQPYLAREATTWMVRIVGDIVFVIGLLLFGLCVVGVFRWLILGSAAAQPLTFAVILLIGLAIASFCMLLGVRLFTGRSRHGDSLLSRQAWTLLGIGFVVFGAATGVVLPWNTAIVEAIGSAALLAVGCFGVASRPRRR